MGRVREGGGRAVMKSAWPAWRCGDGRGRPSIPPCNCFRMLMAGCFEDIGSQRGIAWKRAAAVDATTLEANASIRSAPARHPEKSARFQGIRKKPAPELSSNRTAFEWLLLAA